MRARVQKALFVAVIGLVMLMLAPSLATAQINPRIVREVRHELVTLPYYGVFDWLEYEVQPNGTVILRGQVVRPSTKSDAGRRVREIDGVTNVVNEIETLPLSSNDDRLRIALYRQIYGWNSPLFRYAHQAVPSIHLIVNRGHATLKGVVSNRGDANIANIRARTVPGLFSVKNELRVEGEEPR
jgi:hyperosmotically inducible periplasmic protein